MNNPLHESTRIVCVGGVYRVIKNAHLRNLVGSRMPCHIGDILVCINCDADNALSGGYNHKRLTFLHAEHGCLIAFATLSSQSWIHLFVERVVVVSDKPHVSAVDEAAG